MYVRDQDTFRWHAAAASRGEGSRPGHSCKGQGHEEGPGEPRALLIPHRRMIAKKELANGNGR